MVAGFAKGLLDSRSHLFRLNVTKINVEIAREKSPLEPTLSLARFATSLVCAFV